jgi:hypothetical protein
VSRGTRRVDRRETHPYFSAALHCPHSPFPPKALGLIQKLLRPSGKTLLNIFSRAMAHLCSMPDQSMLLAPSRCCLVCSLETSSTLEMMRALRSLVLRRFSTLQKRRLFPFKAMLLVVSLTFSPRPVSVEECRIFPSASQWQQVLPGQSLQKHPLGKHSLLP